MVADATEGYGQGYLAEGAKGSRLDLWLSRTRSHLDKLRESRILVKFLLIEFAWVLE